MKTILQTLSVSALALSLSAVSVLAHAPTVEITSIGGQDTSSGSISLTVPLLPTTVNVDGTVTHEDPGVVDPVKLSLSDNGSTFYGPTNYFAGSGDVGTAPFSVPWTITSAGSHQIVAAVSHGNSDGTDTVDVTIILNVIVNQCPAAPAIAASYLMNDKGIKSGSNKFKSVMTQVAWQTGINGTLWAGHSCDDGYAALVKAFVDSLL